jgi:hypothetical protein
VWWWLTSPLFRSYLTSFLILWIVAKAAIVGGAMAVAAIVGARLAEPDPLAFAPRAETWACVLELLVLAHFIRRRGEDVLLGNLGLGLGDALAPLVVVHATLSAAVALIGP